MFSRAWAFRKGIAKPIMISDTFLAMLIGYARVSTDDQDTAAQVGALQAARCERIFREKASQRLDLPASGAGGQIPQILDRVFYLLEWTSDGPRSNLVGGPDRGDTSMPLGTAFIRLS